MFKFGRWVAGTAATALAVFVALRLDSWLLRREARRQLEDVGHVDEDDVNLSEWMFTPAGQGVRTIP